MNIKLLTWITTFIVILFTELGDKTQVAVLLITSNNPQKRWTVFGASALALTVCVLIEVTVGLTLARFIQPAQINRIAGFVFLVLGGFILLQEAINLHKNPTGNETTKSGEKI